MKMRCPREAAGVTPDTDAASAPSTDATANVSHGAGVSDLALRRRGLINRMAEPRMAISLLCVCGGLLFLLNLGGYPLYTKGEPREAVTVLDIAHGGGIILPMRAGVEVPSKPLMMHWLAALVSLAAGQVNEWTVRLPSASLAILG